MFRIKKARETSSEPYKNLVKTSFPGRKLTEQENRIITFNYDEILDQHLLKKFSAPQIYFDKIKNSINGSNRRKSLYDHPLMIKLHGSINWRCSTDEYSKMINSKITTQREIHVIDDIWFSSKGLPSPSDDISPLIMPPLPIKPLTQIKIFNYLWTKACEYLHECKEIVICGYSLPEADRLAVSLFSNFKNNNLEQITIVDPEPAILKRWRDLLRRKGINNSVKWLYHADFEEYITEL